MLAINVRCRAICRSVVLSLAGARTGFCVGHLAWKFRHLVYRMRDDVAKTMVVQDYGVIVASQLNGDDCEGVLHLQLVPPGERPAPWGFLAVPEYVLVGVNGVREWSRTKQYRYLDGTFAAQAICVTMARCVGVLQDCPSFRAACQSYVRVG